MKELEINIDKTKKHLVRFVQHEFKKAGYSRAIIGVSGGVDSALSAALCVEALGRSSVIALTLPYGKNSHDIRHSKLVIDSLKIRSELIDISPIVDAYFKNFPGLDRIRRGNKMARERMAILYDQSKRFKAIVVGSGNKTERLLGYYTIHGDSACALNPLAGLYKAQVRQLARAMGIPKEIVERRPTAGLWSGQTDEGELGYKYDDMDRLLYYMIDKRFTKQKLLGMGFKKRFIESISIRIERNKFKHHLPKTPHM